MNRENPEPTPACTLCGTRLTRLSRWFGKRFCSTAHQIEYRRVMNEMAVTLAAFCNAEFEESAPPPEQNAVT